MAKARPKQGIEILSQSPVTESGYPQGVSRVTFRSGADGAEDWALIWPPERGGHWCVVIHGYGSHGDQLFVREDIRRDWLPRFRARGMGILTPNHRNNGWMGPRAAADLHALLSFVRREFGAERFTFVSGSMGGTCNLIYAVLHPEDVAGVVALCPVSDLGLLLQLGARPTSPPASRRRIPSRTCARNTTARRRSGRRSIAAIRARRTWSG